MTASWGPGHKETHETTWLGTSSPTPPPWSPAWLRVVPAALESRVWAWSAAAPPPGPPVMRWPPPISAPPPIKEDPVDWLVPRSPHLLLVPISTPPPGLNPTVKSSPSCGSRGWCIQTGSLESSLRKGGTDKTTSSYPPSPGGPAGGELSRAQEERGGCSTSWGCTSHPRLAEGSRQGKGPALTCLSARAEASLKPWGEGASCCHRTQQLLGHRQGRTGEGR